MIMFVVIRPIGAIVSGVVGHKQITASDGRQRGWQEVTTGMTPGIAPGAFLAVAILAYVGQ